MGGLEQIIKQAIRKHAGNIQVKQVLSGVVSDVGESTCTVEREGSPTLFDVRLNAIDDSLESCFTIFPKPGSRVLVAVIENMNAEAVLLRCSEVERVKVEIGDTKFDIDASGFTILRDEESLLEVLSDLITELQKVVVVVGTSPNVPELELIKQRLKQILK